MTFAPRASSRTRARLRRNAPRWIVAIAARLTEEPGIGNRKSEIVEKPARAAALTRETPYSTRSCRERKARAVAGAFPDSRLPIPGFRLYS
jgi:hypothetical protein